MAAGSEAGVSSAMPALYGVCSLSIFRLDFPPGGARLYPLAKLPAESGGRRRGDFCFGYSDLAIGAVGVGGELGGVRSRSWRDRAAQVGRVTPLLPVSSCARGRRLGQRFRSGGAGAQLWGRFGASRSKPLAEGWCSASTILGTLTRAREAPIPDRGFIF